MATPKQKITLNASRDIPFNKLMLSQSNVRRIKRGETIEDLAASIARRGLLQSLNVRPVLDGEGNETGMFEVPAGGRRYRALELLVKQKRMIKTEPVPCVVSDAHSVIPIEEDSLAENFQREDLHPLDMFRAFQTLHDQGASHEEIAARFFVSATFVQQRLRLAKVSRKLHEVYEQEGMQLDQLMAFTVNRRVGRHDAVEARLCRALRNRQKQTKCRTQAATDKGQAYGHGEGDNKLSSKTTHGALSSTRNTARYADLCHSDQVV
jgi:ParB family chromosome partitioning protein